MNILIISQYFWPESFKINDLAEGLVSRGHNITVLTGKPNYPGGKFYKGYNFLNKNREKYGSIDIIRSPVIPRGKSNRIQLALNYLSFALFSSIVGLLRCKRPDVIFVFEPSPITVGIPALVLKKFKKVPILFWVQDLWPESVVGVEAIRSKKILKVLEYLVYSIYKRCDFILTTSKAFFASIKRFNVKQDKLRYFPQTAESFYQPINLKNIPEEKILPQGFRIIFSGNIGIAQDIENILQAAKILKDIKEIKWIFLGDGSKRAYLQEAIIKYELQENVFWLGQHPSEKMPYFFSCADALLVILKKDPVYALTIPGKIQSYLACAKPILAALDGEGRQVIEEACAGLTTHSGDSVSLAKIVKDLYQLSPLEREKMGLNGRKYFDDNFQRDVLLQNLENWMEELARKYER